MNPLINTITLGALIVRDFIKPGETASISVLLGIISVIPLISRFFKVLWQSLKLLFLNPPINTSSNNLTSAIDDIKKNKNKNEVKQSLFDPCGIIDQVDYFSFIENSFYIVFQDK